ncbi:MAG: thiolase family protein [Proteobacteria bacterium]|nr:thiolase family protein [Pseudomonadota bacterium]
MILDPPVVLGWARSAVVPFSGAFAHLAVHEIGAPVVRALLARSGVPASAVDSLLCGNALGAGGNPARMIALAAGLPDRTSAYSIDTQCCSGLDAVAMGASLITTGQAQFVIAGGAEAWSRAPIRQHRPRSPEEAPVPYERPAFAPDPRRDPDLIQAAADYAAQAQVSRVEQDAYAIRSHAKALAARECMAPEIVPLCGVRHDSYPRHLSAAQAARMPVAANSDQRLDSRIEASSSAVSRLSISPKADGAAFVLLASRQAAIQLGLTPRLQWRGSLAMGGQPEMPMLAAASAAEALLARHDLRPATLWGVELHEAFAVQALEFARALDIEPERLNRGGGGIARGHPIGASGAVSLVRLLADMAKLDAPSGALGLAAIAAAGGLGSAALVGKL